MASPPVKGRSEWTVLVYQDPRSKLREGLADNVKAMMEARLGKEVKVVVQGGGDEQTLDRLVLSSDGVEQRETLDGDPRKAATLDDFLAWGIKSCPSEKTMVILAGHGEGFAGFAADGVSTPGKSGMSLADLKEVLGKYPTDVVVFDSCLMGQAEVLHSLSSTCDYMVASSELIGAAGMPYKPILEQLPGKTPEAAARTLVELTQKDQAAREEKGEANGVLTLAAYDTAQAEQLFKALDATAQAGLEGPPSPPAFSALSSPAFNLEQWHEPFHHFRDLKGYASRLARSNELPPEMRQRAGELVAAVEKTVLAYHAEGDQVYESTGLSVYLPTGYNPDADFGYRQSSMAEATHWDEFLGHMAGR